MNRHVLLLLCLCVANFSQRINYSEANVLGKNVLRGTYFFGSLQKLETAHGIPMLRSHVIEVFIFHVGVTISWSCG